jgi:PAS domain S-box-containing protein
MDVPGRPDRVVSAAAPARAAATARAGNDRGLAALAAAQVQVLELIASGAPLGDVLERLALVLEAQADGMRASVLLVEEDGTLRHGAAPHLPEPYVRAVDGLPVGTGAGPCAAAAQTRRPVVVGDISSDTLWADHRELVRSEGFRSSWSLPVLSGRGDVLGVLAFYYTEPRLPGPHDAALAQAATHVARLAIERDHNERGLRRMQALLATSQRVAHIASYEWDVATGHVMWTEETFRICGVDPETFVPSYERFMDLVHPEDRGIVAGTLETSLTTGQPFHFEERIVRPGGDVRILEAWGEPERDGSGRVRWIKGICQDVTERRHADRALREAEEMYRGIFENAMEGMFQSTPDGGYIAVNPALARLYGYESPQAMVAEVTDIARQIYVDPARRQEFKRLLETTGAVRDFDVEVRRRDGSLTWVRANARYMRGEDGRPGWFQGFAIDVAEQRRTAQALRESEERYRNLFENSRDAVFIVEYGRVLAANPAARELFGYEQDELGQLRVEDLLVSPRPMALLRGLVRDAVHDLEVTLRRRDGAEVHCVASVNPRRDEAGRIVGYEGILRDVTAQRLANWGLRNLSAHLLRLQDDERRKLARELHDSTGQELAGLAMNLAVAVQGSGRMSARAKKALLNSQRLAERCAAEIRTLSYLLHPPLLDESGLVSALRWLADGFTARSGIALQLDLPAEPVRVGGDRETTLFRIAQEALANVHRHSGSPDAVVRLARGRAQVRLEVQDHGRGIPPRQDEPGAGLQRLGVGITGMRERVRQLGGWLEIESSAAGTTVRAVLPLEDEP